MVDYIRRLLPCYFLLTSFDLHRILFVGGYANAHSLMVCSSKEMVTPLVQVLVIHFLVYGDALIDNRCR